MRIDGPHNFSASHIAPHIAPHIARAYGLSPARPALSITSAQPVSQPFSQSFSQPVGTSAAASASKLPSNAQALVAGHVRGPIEFDGVSVPRSNAAALNLYTRAADRIEAATAVRIGRSIDVKG